MAKAFDIKIQQIKKEIIKKQTDSNPHKIILETDNFVIELIGDGNINSAIRMGINSEGGGKQVLYLSSLKPNRFAYKFINMILKELSEI